MATAAGSATCTSPPAASQANRQSRGRSRLPPPPVRGRKPSSNQLRWYCIMAWWAASVSRGARSASRKASSINGK